MNILRRVHNSKKSVFSTLILRYLLLVIITFIIIVFIAYNSSNIKNNHSPLFSLPLSCKDCNIVFVSFDTLRLDHISFMGYHRKTTPTIDQLARNAIIFTKAISVSSWTLPSTMSWFTGVYPSTHRLTNKFTVSPAGEEKISNLKTLSPNLVTLAETLRSHGYRTGGFTGGAGVDHQYGFDQGFETYTDEVNFGGFKDSISHALQWILNHKNKRLFVFLHGYDIHGQYVPDGGYDRRYVDDNYNGSLTGSIEEQRTLREEGLAQGNIFLTKEDVRFLIALYDEKIQRADEKFAKFLQAYTELGLIDNTIFIITSDHGDEFYEHGRIDHGHSLYDELLRVPLLIILPKQVSGVRIDSQVRSIDIMPTILDIVGIPKDDKIWSQFQGFSLIPLLQGKKLKIEVFPETDYRYAISLRAIRTWENWKLILDQISKTRELYNINSDSKEQKNVIDNAAEKLNTLDKMLQNHE